MSRRKVVKINYEIASKEIKKCCRSNVVFCERMGKHKRWITEWKRGRNLPSPEEAARMCAILQVTPEEILTEPEDIELVKSLIDSQRVAQNEKADPPKGTGFKPTKEDWEQAIDNMSQNERRIVMDLLMKKFMEGGN